MNEDMDDIIVAHKQVEQKLRHLTVIAERAREGIVVVDLNGAVRFVNDAWAAMHRYETREELIGKHISAFHTEEQMKTDVIPFIEEVKQRGQLAGPVEHVRRNGTPFPTEMLMAVFKDQAGKAVGLIGFATDLTEHERAKDELKRYRDRLAELVEQQTDKLKATNEQLQREIAQREQVEQDLKRQTAELTTVNEQLQDQISEQEQAKNELQEYQDRLEQRVKEQSNELTAASEQLQHEIAKRKQVEERLKQQTDELKAANEHLQHEIAQHEQAEQDLKRQTAELTTVNEQLQDQISEQEQAKNELQEYQDRLEQRVKEQSNELTAASEQLQHEITKRKQVEEHLKQQTDELKTASERLQGLINEMRARGPFSQAAVSEATGSRKTIASLLVDVFRQNIALQKPELDDDAAVDEGTT